MIDVDYVPCYQFDKYFLFVLDSGDVSCPSFILKAINNNHFPRPKGLQQLIERPRTPFTANMSHEAAAAFAGTLDGKSGKSLTKYLPDTLSCRSDIEVGDSITADVAIIFARGTTEKGNIGISVGPPFSAAIAARLPSLKIAFQGVNYPAEFADMIQWGAVGADTMAELVRTALRANPRIHIVLSGYR